MTLWQKKSKFTMTNPLKFIGTTEAAEYLRIHPQTLARIIKNGKIKAYRHGGLIKLRMEDIDEMAK